MMMKSLFGHVLAIGLSLFLLSCGHKEQPRDIIAPAPKPMKKKVTQKMDAYAQSITIAWLGASYVVKTSRQPDTSLPLADDGNGNKYYDNTITLQVLRPDDSQFFSHTYKKSDFSAYVDESFMKHGALTGIVFDRADGGNLYFVASVGSPDKMSDEYVPLTLCISRLGVVSISKNSDLDG